MCLKTIKFISYFLLFILLGCSSVPPSESLPQSEVAVASIDHANYKVHLQSDIELIQSKLALAKQAATNKDHQTAEQLAQQILVDVELIKLRTQRLNVQQDVNDLEKEIANLHKEIQWREPVQLSPLN